MAAYPAVSSVPSSNARTVYVTRKVSFSAAHRLRSAHLSDENNQALYGKCCNTHGHNYNVNVTVKGKIDERTGMVINIAELNHVMEAVIKKLDHKDLDLDVPYFRNCVSTTENLTVFIWEEMQKALTHTSVSLFEVVVHETEKNTFLYRGE